MRLGELVAEPAQEDCRYGGEYPGDARCILDDVVDDQKIVRGYGSQAYDEPDDETHESFAVFGALVRGFSHDARFLSLALPHGGLLFARRDKW